MGYCIVYRSYLVPWCHCSRCRNPTWYEYYTHAGTQYVWDIYIRNLQRTGAGIAIRHVRSHIKVPGNELADHVADMARGGGIALQAARAWLAAWVGRQQGPGGLGDKTGGG